ncbi:MAG TPA: RNA polymerase sigma factor [Bryobacteraceae bacterium]|jgi:RNA polymerase sigma-70 factor (ECF subfamily)|nr:RNA polymerase sigma factor [Bryobacteraceae bacterium]
MLESPSHSDDDLLRLISKGHESAFVEFYRKHQRAVYRFALHMSGKIEIAEEVTQDVFMTVMGVAKQYDSKRGSATSYLYGITRNFVLRCLERERPYVTALDEGENEPASSLAGDHQDLISELAHNERIESLRKAVLALPPAYREVVVLCDLNEMDYAQAAVALECAIGTIRSRLHRARALLMEKMRAAERCAV